MDYLPSTTPSPVAGDVRPWEDLIEEAERYLRASRSPNTLRAYESDLDVWHQWCLARGSRAFPADPLTVAAFLADQAVTVAPGTLSRRLSALRWAHEQQGLTTPTTHPQVRGVLAGIKRSRSAEPRQVRPIYLDDLRAMLKGVDGKKGMRDRALLTAGWWGAFRRSELAALRADDVTEAPEGLIVRLRKSKTDQEGRGRRVPLAYAHGDSLVCPVRALRDWTRDAGIDSGPLLRQVDRWGNIRQRRLSGEAIAAVVKERAEVIGIDPATVSGHSLRSGFVSECDRRGVPDSAVMRTTGHRTVAMLEVYNRPRAPFDGAAASYFAETQTRRGSGPLTDSW
jgi:integrase